MRMVDSMFDKLAKTSNMKHYPLECLKEEFQETQDKIAHILNTLEESLRL